MTTIWGAVGVMTREKRIIDGVICSQMIGYIEQKRRKKNLTKDIEITMNFNGLRTDGFDCEILREAG